MMGLGRSHKITQAYCEINNVTAKCSYSYEHRISEGNGINLVRNVFFMGIRQLEHKSELSSTFSTKKRMHGAM